MDGKVIGDMKNKEIVLQSLSFVNAFEVGNSDEWKEKYLP